METSRRTFLRHLAYSGLLTPLAFRYPFLYASTAETSSSSHKITGKESLRMLTDRPLNMEAYQHLLDDEITPTEKVFVRNNGHIPPIAYAEDLKDWTLEIYGEVENPVKFSMKDFQTLFKSYEYQLVLECGGNGRAGFYPQTEGLQWTYGAVACPLWKGVRLKDVLEYVKIKKNAVYLAYYGHDTHLCGDPEKVPISRGFPIEKAFDEMTLIAFEMNGKPLTPHHGFPARLVCPGYPASASGKWLKKLWIRNQVHDGPKMMGKSYRVPKYPITPLTEVPENDFQIIETMPVKSIISFPKSQHEFVWKKGKTFSCRGFAWSGHGDVQAVDVSYDFGQTWIPAHLKKPANRFAWQKWEARFALTSHGYYEVWARATDANGKMQPMLVPNWNPGGYLNNAMPRIAIHAKA